MVSDLDLRTLFLESGTSHSGDANSFSPSELLLWPSSGTEPLDNNLANREGRPSSSFPSAVIKNISQTLRCCIEAKGKETTFKQTFKKLTSLFRHGSGLRDVGERVEGFGCEALALFVLQRCYIWQLQRTVNKKDLSKKTDKKSNEQKMIAITCD